jgi:hypothetical protein
MPPAVIAAGITTAGGLVGGAMDKHSQGKARRASASEFAHFADPLLRFGEQSGEYGEKYLKDYDRLGADYEAAIRGELAGLDDKAFEEFRQADLRQSLESAAPQVGNILGAVSGAGFNPSRSGRGTSQIGGLYSNIFGQHADRLTKERLSRSGMRSALADRLGGMGRFKAELGTGFRSEQGSILEAMLQAPPGTAQAMLRPHGKTMADSNLQSKFPSLYGGKRRMTGTATSGSI